MAQPAQPDDADGLPGPDVAAREGQPDGLACAHQGAGEGGREGCGDGDEARGWGREDYVGGEGACVCDVGFFGSG